MDYKKEFYKKYKVPNILSNDQSWSKYYVNIERSLGVGVWSDNVKYTSNILLFLIQLFWAFIMVYLTSHTGSLSMERTVRNVVIMAIGAILIQVIAFMIHHVLYVYIPCKKFIKLRLKEEEANQLADTARKQDTRHSSYTKFEELWKMINKSTAPEELTTEVIELLNNIRNKLAEKAIIDVCDRFLRTYVNELVNAIELNEKNKDLDEYENYCEELMKRAVNIHNTFNKLYEKSLKLKTMSVNSSLQVIDQLLNMEGVNEGDFE